MNKDEISIRDDVERVVERDEQGRVTGVTIVEPESPPNDAPTAQEYKGLQSVCEAQSRVIDELRKANAELKLAAEKANEAWLKGARLRDPLEGEWGTPAEEAEFFARFVPDEPSNRAIELEHEREVLRMKLDCLCRLTGDAAAPTPRAGYEQGERIGGIFNRSPW